MTDSWDVLIRPVHVEDANKVLNLLESIQAEPHYLVMSPEGGLPSLPLQRRIIQSYIGSPKALMIVAELEDEIIGLANLTTYEDSTALERGEVGVCVHPAYRQLGLGQLLMDELMEFGRQVDLDQLILEVAVANHPAIALYQKLGFQIHSCVEDWVQIRGAWRDVYLMEYHY